MARQQTTKTLTVQSTIHYFEDWLTFDRNRGNYTRQVFWEHSVLH